MSANLRERGDALFLRTNFEFEEIIVDTLQIPAALVKPAACRVDKS